MTEGMAEVFKTRELDLLEDLLGFRAEDLRGKTILEIGPDRNLSFARQLEKLGIGCRLVSLSPELKEYPGAKQKAPVYKTVDFSLVAGDCKKLPFKNESFNVILMSHVLEHLHEVNNSEFRSILEEIRRALKPGGVAHIAPAWDADNPRRYPEGYWDEIRGWREVRPGLPEFIPVEVARGMVPSEGVSVDQIDPSIIADGWRIHLHAPSK